MLPPGHSASTAHHDPSLGFLNNGSLLSGNSGNHCFCSCNELPRSQLGGRLGGPCVQSCPALNHSSQMTVAAGLPFFQDYPCEGVPLSRSHALFCVSTAQVFPEGHIPAGTLNPPGASLQPCSHMAWCGLFPDLLQAPQHSDGLQPTQPPAPRLGTAWEVLCAVGQSHMSDCLSNLRERFI